MVGDIIFWPAVGGTINYLFESAIWVIGIRSQIKAYTSLDADNLFTGGFIMHRECRLG